MRPAIGPDLEDGTSRLEDPALEGPIHGQDDAVGAVRPIHDDIVRMTLLLRRGECLSALVKKVEEQTMSSFGS